MSNLDPKHSDEPPLAGPITRGEVRRVLIAGEGDLSSAVVRDLEEMGATTEWLHQPTDVEFAKGLATGPDAVVVVTRDDARALRLALLAAHELPQARLVVTIFDRTVASQLREAVRGCVVVSMADLVAASLGGPCLDDELAAVRRAPGGLEEVRFDGDVVRLAPRHAEKTPRLRRWFDLLVGAVYPFDLSARILVLGMAGMMAMLSVEIVLALIALNESFVDALYLSVRTLVTVGPNEGIAETSGIVRVISAMAMLGTLVSAAVFTAGLVNRLLDARFVSIFGPRAMPRRDHVVVVGMGQVGLRVALLLRDAGVRVVGVERDAGARGLHLAKRYGLPVVVAEGGDRELLARLSLPHARAVAAVTSDDLANVAIALEARAVCPELRIVLRAGDGDIAADTTSLFHLGVVCDAHRLAGIGLASAALGWKPGDVVLNASGAAALIGDRGDVEKLVLAPPGRALPTTSIRDHPSQPPAFPPPL